ncbi:MAG: 23S rRNA (guanosine(2251)-2'-O)-methyltransferase RlmB [Hyphomicrobiales bacterium]|nr:23S rRNA (guanosine(2251)-2'-O)-methyltransferase RlmB [Hyphomicrobiales bacterium]
MRRDRRGDGGRQGRHPEPSGRRPAPRAPQGQGATFRKPDRDLVVLYGLHAVREALRARKRKLLDLHATAQAAEKIGAEAAAAGVPLHVVAAEDLDRRLGREAVHQGVMLEARAPAALDLGDIVEDSGIVLVLDQITDPHNVGAILRTAAAFAVDALVLTDRHAPDFSGVLAKAASGGLEHVPIVQVVNLARAMEELGEMGYQRVGLDSDGAASLEDTALQKPLALVLGAEGAGLRRLTRENCDVMARLDMPGAVKSLNVSNACAVALSVARAKLRAAS